MTIARADFSLEMHRDFDNMKAESYKGLNYLKNNYGTKQFRIIFLPDFYLPPIQELIAIVNKKEDSFSSDKSVNCLNGKSQPKTDNVQRSRLSNQTKQQIKDCTCQNIGDQTLDKLRYSLFSFNQFMHL